MEKGLIHIYTGTGKGKTTAAVGLVIRAMSHGLKVGYCTFNKKPEKYGYTEVETLKKLGATIKVLTDEHPGFNKEITKDQHRLKTESGLAELKKSIFKESYDLLVLDEIIISVRDGFLDESALLNFISGKPENMELVLTGRGASKRLMEVADYVSEINAIKHPMNAGIGSREGIEF